MITISNQTEEPTRLVLAGPGDGLLESGDIPPSGTGSIKAALEEGDYEAYDRQYLRNQVGALTVGPPGESSQNDLLLP